MATPPRFALSRLLIFCVCSKWPPLLTKLTAVAAHIEIGWYSDLVHDCTSDQVGLVDSIQYLILQQLILPSFGQFVSVFMQVCVSR